jgi:hypothetical protein
MKISKKQSRDLPKLVAQHWVPSKQVARRLDELAVGFVVVFVAGVVGVAFPGFASAVLAAS